MNYHNLRSAADQWRLWFGILGGGVAWTLHLLLAYLIAEFGCVSGMDRTRYLGVSLPAWMLLVMSLIMLSLAAAAAIVALRSRSRVQGDDTSGEPDVRGHMTRTGWIASVLFCFIILVQSMPIFFYLQSCGE